MNYSTVLLRCLWLCMPSKLSSSSELSSTSTFVCSQNDASRAESCSNCTHSVPQSPSLQYHMPSLYHARPKIYVDRGASGDKVYCHFCGDCAPYDTRLPLRRSTFLILPSSMMQGDYFNTRDEAGDGIFRRRPCSRSLGLIYRSQGPGFSPSIDRDSGPEDASGENVTSVSVCETSKPPARSVIHCPSRPSHFRVKGRKVVECRLED